MNEKDLINQEVVEESELNKAITLSLLLKYALPTIFAFVVMGTFGIVDSVFAMRVLGNEAMSAVSVIAPFFMVMLSIGGMFAAGGSVVVLKKIGTNQNKEARQNFTLISLIAFVIVLGASIWTFIFPDVVLEFLGANYEIIDAARYYLRIVVWSFPLLAMGQLFNQFIIADGKPGLGMGISLLGSVSSAALNATFLLALGWGIEALAWATLIGSVLPVGIAFILFCNNRKGTIYFTTPKFDIKALGLSVLNGTGATIPILASAIITILMNNVLVRMDGIGALGIAAAGMVMGIFTTLTVISGGYLAGTMPLVSFNYGRENHNRLKQLFSYHLKIIAIISIIVVFGTLIFANLLIRIYLPSEAVGSPIYDMAVRGLRITAIVFVASGFNGLVSAMFAAVNKGALAGTISSIRAFVFNLPLLLFLPRILDLDGVWLAMPIAEGLTIIISIALLFKLGKRYHFLGKVEDVAE